MPQNSRTNRRCFVSMPWPLPHSTKHLSPQLLNECKAANLFGSGSAILMTLVLRLTILGLFKYHRRNIKRQPSALSPRLSGLNPQNFCHYKHKMKATNGRLIVGIRMALPSWFRILKIRIIFVAPKRCNLCAKLDWIYSPSRFTRLTRSLESGLWAAQHISLQWKKNQIKFNKLT